MNLVKSLGTLEAGVLFMRHTEVPRSRRSQFLMETSYYVSVTRSIQQYPFGSVPNNFKASCIYNSGIFVIVLIAPMRSMIRVDDLFGSSDITKYGLFGGVVKVAVTISSNLLFAVWCPPPLVVAMLKGTGDSGYSKVFS